MISQICHLALYLFLGWRSEKSFAFQMLVCLYLTFSFPKYTKGNCEISFLRMSTGASSFICSDAQGKGTLKGSESRLGEFGFAFSKKKKEKNWIILQGLLLRLVAE